jgi:hypothetical protein
MSEGLPSCPGSAKLERPLALPAPNRLQRTSDAAEDIPESARPSRISASRVSQFCETRLPAAIPLSRQSPSLSVT